MNGEQETCTQDLGNALEYVLIKIQYHRDIFYLCFIVIINSQYSRTTDGLIYLHCDYW